MDWTRLNLAATYSDSRVENDQHSNRVCSAGFPVWRFPDFSRNYGLKSALFFQRYVKKRLLFKKKKNTWTTDTPEFLVEKKKKNTGSDNSSP